MYTSPYEYAVQLNWYCLSLIGAWPSSKNTSYLKKYVNLILIVFTYVTFFFDLIPCALYTFLEETNPLNRITWYGPMNFCIMGFVKFTSLLNSQSSIKKCHKHIEIDWEESENIPSHMTVMLKNAKFGRFMAIGCATLMYGGILLYTNIPILTLQVKFNAKNTENMTVARPLSYAVYSKWINAQMTPTYEIIYFLQMITMLVNSTVTVSVCSIAAVFIMHTCGQLELVMMHLHELMQGDCKNHTLLHDGIGAIVRRHIRALSLASQIEKILRWICLVEFFGNCANMCLLGYYLITTWSTCEPIVSITYIVLYISFVLNIFILCYMGEILSEQCRKVGEVSYAIDWYRVPGNKSLDLILILLIASFPAKLTAGKMIDLSLVSFSGALKSSAVYLNLLRKLTS